MLSKINVNTAQFVAMQVARDYEARKQVAYIRRMRSYRQNLIERGILRLPDGMAITGASRL